MSSFLNGLFLGLAYAIPIGALNIFVIQSALASNKKRALTTGLAVSLFDALLGLACFFGIGAIFTFFPILKPLLLLTGAVFLLKVGYKLLVSESDISSFDELQNNSNKAIWYTSLLLTWGNPHAIIDGTILLGGVRASLESAAVRPFLMGALVALPIWYFSIVVLVRIFKEKMSPSIFSRIQKLCGMVLIYFGFKFLLALFGVIKA